jgi:hypothetical protein
MSEFFATMFAGGEAAAGTGAGVGTAATVGEGVAAAGEVGTATGAASTYGTISTSVSATDIIQGGAQAFGILSQLRAGQAEEGANKLQARMSEVNAKASAVKAHTDENTARERLIATLAKNTAAAANAGVDLSSGSVVGAQDKAAAQANREIDTIHAGGELEQEQQLMQASILRQRAKAARAQGQAGAFFGLLDYAAKRSRVR